MPHLEVPTITDERLEELARQIKPVVMKDGRLFYIEPTDMRTIAFMWSPVYREAADDLRAIDYLDTLHSYGYYGFFKPTIAETLATINTLPEELITKVSAFSVHGPEDRDELNAQWSIVQAGFHQATTILYATR
jgi:hypothetical protein